MRKLFLLAAMVVASMAMMASSAFAQSVEVVQESTGLHCDAVTVDGTSVSGGCQIHATSTSNVLLENHTDHAAGAEDISAVCRKEFDGAVNEDGHGYIYNQVITDPAGTNDCVVRPCDGGTPWEAELTESGGVETLTVDFCVEDAFFGINVSCTDLPFTVTQTGHTATLAANDQGCANNEREVTGTWATEAADTDAEIIH